jgi:CRP/FNR family transcriptional regulator, cyclic AMP receptor protein
VERVRHEGKAQSGGAGRWPPGTLLDNLGEQLEQRLLSLGRECSFTAGKQLLRQGDPSTHVFVLLTGVVKVSAQTINGRNILLAIRIAGDLVGELAAADGRPRTASVTSCGNVVCRLIPAPVWRTFLDSSTRAHSALNKVLSDRFRAETDRRVEFTDKPAPERIALVLHSFACSYGTTTTHGRELTFPLSQPELAAAADCAVASVRSTLRSMRDHGILKTRYRRLILFDTDALARWPLSR